MGVYTYLEKTLGLKTSPRLEKMLLQIRKGEDLDKEDLKYVLNEAARFYTLCSYRKDMNFKMENPFSVEGYAIKELFGDIITELKAVSLSNLYENNEYHINFPDIQGKRWRDNLTDLKSILTNNIRVVKAHQKEFDSSGDKYKVIGHFDNLEVQYGFKYQFTADKNTETILSEVFEKIKHVLLEEQKNTMANILYIEKQNNQETQ